jgi:hypothetical protein
MGGRGEVEQVASQWDKRRKEIDWAVVFGGQPPPLSDRFKWATNISALFISFFSGLLIVTDAFGPLVGTWSVAPVPISEHH